MRLERVTRRFGGLVAVDDVSLDVRRARRHRHHRAERRRQDHAVQRHLRLSDAPSAGRVIFAGEHITGLAPEAIAARGLVRTFQLVQLFDDLTVLENVKVGRHLQTRGGSADRARRHTARRTSRRRSRRRRAALARARRTGGAGRHCSPRSCPTARSGCSRSPARSRPSPSSSCSTSRRPASIATRRTRLASLLRQIADARHAVLLIEHDMSLVMNVADRVAVLDFGRMIAEGTPSEVRQNPRRHRRLSRNRGGGACLSSPPRSIASGIAVGCIYGLIGIGFCVIYNASGIVNFAQGAFVMLGGMLTYVAAQHARASPARGRRARDRAGRRAWRRDRAAGRAAAVEPPTPPCS